MHFYYGQLVDKVSSFYLFVGSMVAENACQKCLLLIRVLKQGVQESAQARGAGWSDTIFERGREGSLVMNK